MSPRIARRWIASSFVALLPLLLGYTCGVAGGPNTAPQTEPVVYLFFDLDVLAVTQGVTTPVRILASTGFEFQAYDIDIKSAPQHVLLHSAVPVDDFDDNGTFLVNPSYDIPNGEIKKIVDFRHGSAAATGLVELAEFTLYPHTAGSGVQIEFTSARISDALGQEVIVVPENKTFDVSP